MSSSNRLVLSTNVCGTKLQASWRCSMSAPFRKPLTSLNDHVSLSTSAMFVTFAASRPSRLLSIFSPVIAAAPLSHFLPTQRICGRFLSIIRCPGRGRENLCICPLPASVSPTSGCALLFFVTRKIRRRVCAGFLCLALLSDSAAIDLPRLKLPSDFDTCASTFSSCL